MTRASPWCRLARDRRGLAGLEFGLIAPVMTLVILATIELTNAIRAQAKLNTAAGQLVEMIAAQPSVTAPGGTLADFCTGAAMNLMPYGTGTLSANIASVTNDHPSNRPGGSTDSTSVQTFLDWENRSACPATPSGTLGLSGAFVLVNMPLSLLTQSGAPASGATDAALQFGYSALAVQAQYRFSNVLRFLLGDLLTLTAVAVARPRRNGAIACTQINDGPSCPLES